MLNSLLDATFHFDLGVVGLPIGFGILRGKASSRKWALFFSGAGAVIYSLIAVWLTWKRLDGDVLIRDEYPLAMFALLPLVAASVFVFLILKRADTAEWFSDTSEGRAILPISGGIVAIVAAYLCLNTVLTERGHRLSLEEVFVFNTRLEVFDEDTDERIGSIGVKSSSIVGERRSAFPKVTTSFGWKDGAHYIELAGAAMRSYQTTISATGYEDANVVIGPSTPGVIKVRMKKNPRQPNQALQTTSVTRSGFEKASVSDRQRRGV